MLAVFASSAAIIWFAYGESGDLSAVSEPILVKAPSTPLKMAPDDPGGSTIAELGGIGDLLSDEPAVREERLLPPPEQPVTPGEAAGGGSTVGPTADGSPGGGSGTAALPDAQERGKARAALEALVSEIRSDAPRSPAPAPTERVATRIGSATQAPLQTDVTGDRTVEVPATSSSDVTETAALEPTRPANGGTVANSVSVGRFRVQLAAVRSEDDAKRAWALFQEQLGGLIGGLTPLCVELKKLNASCFVVSR